VTLVLAHRGANRQAPENTLAAFTSALESGADGVELDVHRTADHQLVVRHDAAGAGGILAELTTAAVAEHFPDVPTLSAALDVCAGRLVNVEIKNLPHQPGFDPSLAVADLVVELLAARGGADRVLVSSFHLPTIDRVHELRPELATGLLTAGGDPLRALTVAHERAHRAVHPALGMLAGQRAREVVERAHATAMQVNVWTVNEPDDIRRLADAGVDAVITDVPDVARAVLRERRA